MPDFSKPVNAKAVGITKTRKLFGNKRVNGTNTVNKNIQSYKNMFPAYQLRGTQSEIERQNVAGGGRSLSCYNNTEEGVSGQRKLVVRRGNKPYCRGPRAADMTSTRQQYIKWLADNKGRTPANPKKIPFERWNVLNPASQ